MEEFLIPLDEVIDQKFIPILFGTEITSIECDLFSLPIRCGGLSVPKLSEKAHLDYQFSKQLIAPLIAVMIIQENTVSVEDNDTCNKIRAIKEIKS